MKVHITSIPGYSKENIEQVVSLLSEVNGEISYSSCEPITPEQLMLIDDKFENFEKIKSLSFQDFFKIANKYKVIKSIPKEDILAVLSPIRHDLNWFSGASGKNIFVDTRGWEYITDSDSKYGIAYQIIENIFQLLVGIEHDNAISDPNVHHTSIGCINDMCGNKMEVISKLRSAYICVSCQQRAINKNVSKVILLQIISTIQKIRDGLMNFDLILKAVEPLPTVVNENGVVTIGKKEIKLQAMLKTLFIFYLSNIDGVKNGVRVDSLDERENKQRLIKIYKAVRITGKLDPVDNLCIPQNVPGSTFPKVRTETNKYLIKELDKILSEFYVINNFRESNYNIYKILLPVEYLTFKLPL
ncbi:MAG: hypothetical protein PHP53_23545 [Prolixibacteraceae bacterium]|nr:hypothetical protein [Prolixibacteraceae bacterium]